MRIKRDFHLWRGRRSAAAAARRIAFVATCTLLSVITACLNPTSSDQGTGSETADAPSGDISVALAAADDSGASDSDGITNRTTGLTLSGTTEAPGATVRVVASGNALGVTAAAEDGAWSMEVDLSEGTHQIIAQLLDQSDSVVGESEPLPIVVDTTPPEGSPRLLKPRIGANTGTDLTPEFRWSERPADERMEIQLADTSTIPYSWSGLEGTSFTPPEDLEVSTSAPVGKRYWIRIRAVDPAGNAGPWDNELSGAPTRYMNVGRFDGDFNGDGHADMLVGDYRESSADGRIYVFFGGDKLGGSSDDFDGLPDVTREGTSGGNDRFGMGVSYAGDVNGDGFQDILVGAIEEGSQNEGAAHLFLGSASPQSSGGPTSADLTISNPINDTERFGYTVSSAGDVNADGYDDFLIGAYFGYTSAQTGGYSSYVGLYLGGDTPDGSVDGGLEVEDSGRFTTQSEYVDDFSIHPGRAGDLNGDGYADFTVGRPLAIEQGFSGHNGRLEVYFGGTSIPSTLVPDTVLSGGVNGSNEHEYYGAAAYGAGDLNDDGYDDLIVGNNFGEAHLFFGESDFDPGSPDVVFEFPESHSDWSNEFGHTYKFGADIAPLGDFNGDGIDDVVIGARAHTGQSTNSGAFALYYGRASWPSTVGTFDRWGLGGGYNYRLGDSIGSAGDVNGDGKPDMVVGEWGAARVRFYFGKDGPIAADLLLGTEGFINTERFGMGLGRAW